MGRISVFIVVWLTFSGGGLCDGEESDHQIPAADTFLHYKHAPSFPPRTDVVYSEGDTPAPTNSDIKFSGNIVKQNNAIDDSDSDRADVEHVPVDVGSKSSVSTRAVSTNTKSTDGDEQGTGVRSRPSTSFGPVSSPFFFMCQYPRTGEPSGAGQEDVTLKVQFTGNKTPGNGYDPLAVYEVLVTANVVFDGFLITGVHAFTKQFTQANYLTLPASMHGGATEGLVCSVLHSHISAKPRSSLSFLWMAPPSGTGCVAFLAQGSLRNQILFKDLSVLEVCEKDKSLDQLLKHSSRFAGLNQHGYVFRDDFEDHKLNGDIWSGVEGGSVGREAGKIIHGAALSFSSPDAGAHTYAMDLSAARQLQFALGTGDCSEEIEVQLVYGRASQEDQAQLLPIGRNRYLTHGPVVSAYVADDGSGYPDWDNETRAKPAGDDGGSGEFLYPPLPGEYLSDQPDSAFPGTNLVGVECESWEPVHTFRAGPSSEVHIQRVPARFRAPGVCVGWRTIPNHDNRTCWGLDDVALTTNHASQHPVLDDFDPVDPTNWMFFPGAKVKEWCGSEGNSLVFEGAGDANSRTTTRLLDLSAKPPPGDIIVSHRFFTSPPSGWQTEGAKVAHCAGQKQLAFSGEGPRTVCTPYIDARSVGVVTMLAGLSECHAGHSGMVSLRVVSQRGNGTTLLGEELITWSLQEYTLPVPPQLQLQHTRFCVEQKEAGKKDQDVWVLDHLTLLPWLPEHPQHFFQARVNLECGGVSEVDVESSSDGGATWTSLHRRCLPGACPGAHSALTSALLPEHIDRWGLVTLPLPYVSLTPNTRLRVRQLEDNKGVKPRWWALDNVYIGRCPQGCNGRGLCQPDGRCKCEYGYSGSSCEEPDRDNPVYISEPFSTTLVNNANILKMSGGSSSYRCGVVGAGTAAVFSGRGPRALTTVDVNTTNVHFLQFHYVAGTQSDVGKCPGPDEDNESVYVHYSCDGGVTWHLLHTLHARTYKEPSHISLEVPGGARGPGCRFQVWQERHSGAGRDIWAVDDLTITSHIFNTIQLDFSDGAAANNSLRFHLGEVGGDACGHDSALIFGDIIASGASRFMETKSIGVGPSYMIQFDLVIGCGDTQPQETPNKVVLEYSVNHGITWQLVHRPCTPSTPGCHSHFTRGTVYHASEFPHWKRVTLRLPQHTWSPSTRLRLRQAEESEMMESWAVDNLYIGRQCPGLCSGHGHCTLDGCRCDDNFHGHKCLPLDKLHREIDATFDTGDDVAKYEFQVTGGAQATQEEGCGNVVSGKSLYFGAPGVREWESDDLNAQDLEIIQFVLVIGSGMGSTCLSGDQEETLNAGSVVLEYSTDGGISWSLLQELLPSHYRTPAVFRGELADEVVKSESGVVRFRLWQPNHQDRNQWAFDNLRISHDTHASSIQADFSPNSLVASPWLRVTGNHHASYCGSDDAAQVMDGTEPLRQAVTNQLTLLQDDVITFQISVGCDKAEEGRPVLLQYSKDGGVSWALVVEGCPAAALHCHGPKEPSVYRPGHHGPWTRVLIPVDHRLAQGSVQLRWVQDNPSETTAGEFALRGLYIGPPCPYACHGHGLCTGSGICRCDEGYNGTYCGRFPSKNPEWMHDSFDTGEVSGMWERVEGGAVSLGCGPHHSGNALLFSAAGPRFATTNPIDTRYMKYLVFNLQIGSLEGRGRCQQGQVPRDNVVLEYSTDNGQTWSLLQQFEPTHTTSRKEAFFIPLPQAARARQTRFRWWQGYNDMMLGDDPTQEERAEWHLDNVMALANETLPRSLYDAFDGNRSEASPWFLMAGASVAPACGRDTNVLHFSGQQAPKYAETWDIRASEATVIQFDIEVGCSGPPSPISVHLQYSTDHGKNWKLVRELCAPPHVECDTFHLPTSYSAAVTPGWTRVTTTLPKTTVGERTRVRVVEEGDSGGKGSRGGSWAIDNIYLGETCPWMCSGHGYCDNYSCRCDEGYFGPYCVPAEVLPCELLDTFRQPDLQSSLWLQAHGSEVSQRCGVLVSDSALVFFKEGLRMATTIDLDMTAGEFLQFTLRLGCDSVSGGRSKRSATILEEVNGLGSSVVVGEASRAHGILVQYSTNGGITWSLLKEIHFKMQLEPMFVSISLVDFPMSRSNATRFRVWQPRHGGTMTDTWAIDNVFIGGMPISPNVLYDDFNSLSPMTDAWIDWPAGEVGHVCDEYDSYTGLVFKNQEGEHALYTRDLQVDDHSVIQFDLRVGCGEVTGREHNLTLQYSTDYGVTWRTVRPLPALRSSSPDCLHELRTPTVFYPNSDRKWARVVIPLTGLQICGRARFRWWQGYYRARESAAPWGLDNVYIGPSCVHHCAGQGYCINGDQCVCDDNFDGNDTCILMNETRQTLSEDFEKGTVNTQFDKWSGAEVSRFCGVVTGEALVFSQQGERMLVTEDLDLTHGSVVQFYIRFGCTVEEATPGDGPVLLQYSRDGGISWALLAELSPDSGGAAAAPGSRPHTQHLTLPIPGTAKSNTTRLRWWQPSQDGTFTSQWAVDQIHIGSAVLGVPAFTDIDTGIGWLLRPGSVLEQVCGLTHNSLHFASRDGYRFAETPDIHMTDHSFIQFTVSLGCKDSGACFEVELEYSTDQGASWWRIKESCLPSDPDCTEYWPASTLISDLYTGPSQVTLSIPHRVRSALTRVRFIQREGWKQQHSWALSHVYMGDECYHMCAGRGFCDAGQCHCQKGWTGDNCEEPATPLAKYIVGDFNSEDWTSDWSKVVGGQLTDHCGPIASGQALHFLGGCSRYLETKNLDLQEALFVQFDLRTGCLDPVSGREAGGDHTVLLQVSCDAGISWTTLRKLLLIYHQPQYVWVELPQDLRCMGGRVRWWQPDGGERNRYDWAVDGVVVGGSVTPPDNLTYTHPHHLVPPLWLRRYNTRTDTYCDHHLAMHVMMSTPSEPAILQTTDLQVSRNHSVSFLLALGCGATWDNTAQPVRLEYSLDFGHTWRLVRDMCLPGNSSCAHIADASIFYAPLKWNRYVYPLNHIGPAKYVRFRWVQDPSSDVSGRHQWSLRDVYIGEACPYHCLGRGSCIDGVCRCDYGYAGPYCQHVTVENVAFIRDQFSGGVFQPHFLQVQGGLLSEGCGGLEEPPTATFQGPNTRLLLTRPVDTRSAKFVHFTTQVGSGHGSGICRSASHRHHNVFLQYSIDGGIRWHLLRELDHQLYTTPNKEYILIPAHARSPATTFRFWQPRLASPPPAWSLDDLYIGGSEISAAELIDQFEGEPTVSEWLFAPHSRSLVDYCSSGTNGSLVWGPDSPGHRAITTQELIIHDAHILQFKVSVGCGDSPGECGETPGVRLEYSRDGGVTGWELVHDSCLPGSSPDPDCLPYTFHPQSIFHSDTHSHWKRITIPLPEKTWGSTTQLRWVQEVRGPGSKVTPWSLDDVYVGYPCPSHCHGRGDCLHATCTCDPGYSGESCEPVPSRITPLPTSLVDGFEGGVLANWALVTGGGVGLGCSSLAPYSHGKHLYFSGCGTRQAVTKELDTRSASKLIFVLRIGSHDHTPSCYVDLSDPQRALDKGVILQYTNDNGITWTTVNVHDPLDFRKARRVAYTLPGEARRYGVQLRWWQPDHDGPATDQWALDNVEIVLAQRKDTSRYDQQTYHEPEL